MDYRASRSGFVTFRLMEMVGLVTMGNHSQLVVDGVGVGGGWLLLQGIFRDNDDVNSEQSNGNSG